MTAGEPHDPTVAAWVGDAGASFPVKRKTLTSVPSWSIDGEHTTTTTTTTLSHLLD
jgi:hypothetical protein